MKKSKRVCCLMMLCGSVMLNSIAQSPDSALLSKKGKPILPASGQIALGFDATPVFSYLGNLMNLDGYNTLFMDLLNNQVYAKYLISDNSAVRLKLQVNNQCNRYTNLVVNDLNTDEDVEDQLRTTFRQVMLTPGFEMRSGKTRLQLVYGAELYLSYLKSKNSYSYGNEFAVDNTAPTSTINFNTGTSTSVVNRLLESTTNAELGLGLRLFTGLEYFVLPRLSMGAEVGLGYYYSVTDKLGEKSEFWDFTDQVTDTLEDEQPWRGETSVTTDILNGRIAVLYYF